MAENKKIVILHMLGCLGMGGAENRIMDLVRKNDDPDIEYAFLVNSKGPDHFDEEILSRGLKIYRTPKFKVFNYFSYKKAHDEFFKNHPEITIVQGNTTNTASMYLPLAKKYGMVTIAHSRSAGVEAGIKKLIVKMLTAKLPESTDYMWACSTDAAIGTFGEKAYKEGRVKIIFDNIDTDRFAEGDGDKIRDEYGVKDKLVIGHVGSFLYPKNHEFLIEIFNEIHKWNKDSVLLMVGGGPLEGKIREKVKNLSLEDACIFAGKHTNIEDYYKAFDMMVFPSHYEGLPGAILEAQAAGVPVIASDVITRDVDVTGLIKYLPLQLMPGDWAEECQKHLEKINENKKCSEPDYRQMLKDAGFDVKLEQKKLNEVYHELAKERK